MPRDLAFTLPALRAAYAGGLRPEAVIAEAFARLDALDDPGIFLFEARETALAEARALGAPDGRPLWGIPYAVKDNIDVADMPTTAACPDFLYRAEMDAAAVARLRALGAICLGKANLDQFATGLVGVRTPYPVPRNAIDPELVPGGSSSGSAVAVARGLVAFSLGTDTAGSGRVPAALNDIVGLKPSLGALSSAGMVPACRTLDTVSLFAHSVGEAWELFGHCAGFDPADPYSRPLPRQRLSPLPRGIAVAVPDAASLRTFGDEVQERDFRATVERLRADGASVREIDLAPFYAVADLLYAGPWVAERVAAVGARLTVSPDTLHEVTRAILAPGLKLSAVDAFKGLYRLEELRRVCAQALEGFDFLCVPTIPCFVTLDEVAADPFGPNSRLGTYTNFVNLLDMCGIAVPTGPRPDGRPGSVTVLARKGEDARAAALALRVERGAAPSLADAPVEDDIAGDEIAIAVCGAHMAGLPLNGELTSRGGRFLREARTSPAYQLFALPGGPPARPGLVRARDGQGAAIALEIWALPRVAFGDFLAGIPAPLAIGTVALEDGLAVKGFLCEPHGLAGGRDITASGGWRAAQAAAL
ncbi:allophanate hydrolase [Ancylobacter aquaticus]|uniref:Allophanate hydrolase n=1 Tax=Ancylobacter aquaticus TaxID=100 RepID=A0A4V2PI80_ANCAQ|nr:allophanate hydrolase [Ancylobacter aquaticus]TCK23606.1 allophanate hydrolase [Ancylobacter aquaticus]